MVAACWRTDQSLGELDKQSIKDIWNNAEYDKMRQTFLDGYMPEECVRCADLEKNPDTAHLSLKSRYQQLYSKYHDDIMYRVENGLPQRLRTIELRFGSVCNFTCLHCNGLASTSWRLKQKNYPTELRPFYFNPETSPVQVIDETVVDDLTSMYEDVDYIMITGGEPLVDPINVYFLDTFPKEHAAHIDLLYVSNLSILKYREHDLVELWKKFRRVEIRVSMDGDEQTYDYFRYGGKYTQLVNNIKQIQRLQNNIVVSGVTSVNILNISRLDRISAIHKELNMKFVVAFVQDRPDYLDVRNMPESVKNDIARKLQPHMNNPEIERSVKFMYSKVGDMEAWNKLKAYVKTIDSINNTNFSEVYPEFTNDYFKR